MNPKRIQRNNLGATNTHVRTHRFITWKNKVSQRQVSLRIRVTGQTLSEYQIRRIDEACGTLYGTVANRILEGTIDLPLDWLITTDRVGFWIGPIRDIVLGEPK